MASVLLRELGFLFVGIAAGAAASLSVFYRFSDIVAALPLALCGILLFSRWPMRGEGLWRRRVLLGLAAFCFLVFEASALTILTEGPRGSSSDWYFLVLGALGYIAFSLLDPIRRSKQNGKPIFRYGLRLVFFAAFLVAVIFAYLREADWMGKERFAAWCTAPTASADVTRINWCVSAVLLKSEQHPFRGIGTKASVVVVLWSPRTKAEFENYPNRATWRVGGNREWESWTRRAFERFVDPEDRVQAEINWDSAWGDPFEVVDEFARDETVKAWTKEEFLKWIEARGKGAK